MDRSVVHHRVRPSQSLSQIARLYGVTVNDVAAANGIRDPNVVPVGVVLTVPVTLYGPRHLPTTLRRSLDRVRLLPAFESAARQCGVPVDLLESMAWMESGWQNSVVSATGAIGVGQLMPGTARLMAARLGDSRLDPRRPADNIRMSACYLRFLLDRYNGDHRLALMAYNQGWGSLDTVGATPGARRYAMVIENQRSQFLPGG
ncbi:MAG: putative lysozyme [Acidimicrobiia bacterium]|nr:putative lysozyme [Acidimicrobiia bacterium]